MCHFGILPGWSSWDQKCGYKGCRNRAVFHYVPGSVKNVCHGCAHRPKVGLTGGKVTLAEYVTKCITEGWRARGVVRFGEAHMPRPLFLSADVEREVSDAIAHAMGAYRQTSDIDAPSA